MPKKISDLTATSALQSGDLWEVSRAGTSSLSRDAYDEFADNLENVKGLIWNIGLAETRASSALTIFFKQKDGSTDLTSGIGRGRIGFRSTTQTSGGYVVIDCVATTSTTINANNTLGFVASKDEDVHIYAYNDAGTAKIAYSGSWSFDEGVLQNITAQSTVATVKTTLFAATAASNVAVRYMGKMTFNLGTPGNWVTAATSIVNAPIHRRQQNGRVICDTGNGHGTVATKIRRFTNATTTGIDITRASSVADGDTFTINKDGLYSLVWQDLYSGGQPNAGFSLNSNQLTTDIQSISAATLINRTRAPGSGDRFLVTTVVYLLVGDIVRCHDEGNLNGTTASDKFVIQRIGD